jgi:predicted CopG family antitoxin
MGLTKPLKHKKYNCIYFLKTGNLIKIGRSNHLYQRLTAFKVDNPFITLVGLLIREDHTHIEKKLHQKFDKHFYKGEWFEESQGLHNFILQEMNETDLLEMKNLNEYIKLNVKEDSDKRGFLESQLKNEAKQLLNINKKILKTPAQYTLIKPPQFELVTDIIQDPSQHNQEIKFKTSVDIVGVKETKKTTTVAIEQSVYTELENMKIIPADPFSDLIKRLIFENQSLKKNTYICKWQTNPLEQEKVKQG